MSLIYMLSGPTKKGFSEEICNYLVKDLKNKKVITFIASTPNAFAKNDLYVYGDKNIVGMITHLKSFTKLLKINILDERVDKEEGKKMILNSDVVYLLGGDCFKQINYLKDNKYDEVLKKYKGIILGTSAGAMNIAKKVYYSKDEDYQESIFYDGIDLVDITIDPHFEISNKEQIEEAKNNSLEHKIVGLPNISAIRVENGKIQYINKCYIFENGIYDEIN